MALVNIDVDVYLEKLGLRTKGTRGRLSEDCKVAVEIAIEAGMTFINWDNESRKIIRAKPEPKTKKERSSGVYAPAPLSEDWVLRGADTIRITDEEGVVSNFQTHSWGCGKAISRCSCKDIGAPKYIVAKKVELVNI